MFLLFEVNLNYFKLRKMFSHFIKFSTCESLSRRDCPYAGRPPNDNPMSLSITDTRVVKY